MGERPTRSVEAEAFQPRPLHRTGETIGPYRLLSVLGEGGFGVVYLAERREPHIQRVALKVIKPGMDSKAVLARFEQERQALAVMDHPNVARVFDGGATPDGRPYFVMEHVKGEPITAYCDRERLSIKTRLELFIPVCEAVQHAHMKGIIHRDLKPSNVLVEVVDGKPIPKVIDFGVAKAIGHALTEKTIFTEHGLLIGTPEYMSPEQAEMSALDVDTRTDVYSLGVILYELLTGALPFDSASLRAAGFAEIQRIIREVEPPRPSTKLSSMGNSASDAAHRRRAHVDDLAGALRKELEWIPLKAMRKDRTHRYATAIDVAGDIRNYLEGRPLVAGPESAAYRLRKFVRRHRGPVVAAIAIILALIAGVVGTSVGLMKARRAETRARTAETAARDEAAVARAQTGFLVNTLASASPQEDGPSVKVVDVLNRGGPSIDSDFADAPRVRASLHGAYAQVYRSLSLHPKAEEHYRAALAATRATTPRDDGAIIDLQCALGWTLLEDLGRDGDAYACFREASTIQESLPSVDPLDAAARHEDLAGVLHNFGEYDVAEHWLRLALAKRRAAPKPDAALGWCMGRLGRLLIDAGWLEEGERLTSESLEFRRREEGDRSLSAAYGLLFQGYARHARGDFKSAADLCRQARDMYAAELETGARSLVAMARMDLAGALEDAAVSPAADPDASFKADDLGHMRWIAAISLRNRGRILHSLGRSAEGDDRFERSIAVDESIGAMRAFSLGHTLRVRAEALISAGSLTEGEPLLRRALARQQSVAQGPAEIALAPTLLALGDLLTRTGRAAEAEPLLSQAVRLRSEAAPNDSWPVAVARVSQAACLIEMSRATEAAQLLRPALDTLIVQFGPDHPRARKARALLDRAIAPPAGGTRQDPNSR